MMSVIRMEEFTLVRTPKMAHGNARRQSVCLIPRGVNTSGGVGTVSDLAETDAGKSVAPAEIHERSTGKSDRWAVVLFDDSHHSMDYVIWALLKTVPELSTADASLIMLEAHNTGKGVVTLCGLAQAEKYRDSLRVLQLGCDIEPGW
jgi:ATP-dependent Clp protease adaptor protein ClpS